ncbi:hypothetical protein BASA83_008876 [Batrachochytrium salamandrivorans]|nr:hypothetical protein BASA83_008876 [Batrachochytrium salamandrivorans]
MRVGTGIILSVLSFNVLAAVITNYDSHDPLLVRRTLNPDNKGILWKRANEEQMEPGPSNSGAGIGDGSPNYSSGNRGSSKLKRFREMQSTGKKQTKANLQSVTRAIARIAKQPRNVIKEMEKIVKSISRMCQVLDTLYDEYRDLVSKMGFAGTERTIKVTEAHVVGMNMFQFGTSESLDSIKEQINEGLVIFKGKFEGKIQSKSRRH